MNEIEIEILEYSYWEHFKCAKDLGLVLPVGHSKRIVVESELKKINNKIHELKAKIKLL